MKKTAKIPKESREGTLPARIQELESRLTEAEETLRAIRDGEVDALVTSTPDGDKIFTLTGAEQPYRIMIEMLNEGAATLSDDGTIFYSNQRFADMLGTPLDKLIGTSVYRFVASRDRGAMETAFRQSSYRGETAFVMPDGSALPVLLSLNSYQDTGSPATVCMVATDVTALKQAEDRIRQERQRLFDVLETLPAMICLLTPDYRVAFANRSFREKFGESRGRHCYEHCFGYSQPCDFCESYKVLETGRPHHWEVRAPDGSIIDAYDFPFTDADGSPLILEMDFDITAQRKSEAALKELAETLEQRVAERTNDLEEANKEMESFSYSVSHDLRAPLRAIDGFSSMLLKKHGPEFDRDSLRKFNVIRSNVRKMGQLIDDLLTISRLGRREMSFGRIDMAALVNGLWKDLRTANADRAIRLTANSLPEGYGDAVLLGQAMLNLLSNAVKFTKTSDLAVIEVGGSVGAGETVYFVRDNGVGFDMAYYDKLFQVFQRLHNDEEHEGTGVGLAIVQRIVHRHGGRVWAEGKEGEGATFYFALPSSPV